MIVSVKTIVAGDTVGQVTIDFITRIRIKSRRGNDATHRRTPRVAKDVLQEAHDVKDADEREEKEEDESKGDPKNKG